MARDVRSGLTYVEALVSALVLAVSLMAMMSLWSANMSLTEKHADSTMSYNLGRSMMERIKLQGFAVVPEGQTVLYFDANGGQESDTQSGSHKFQVTIDVISDKTSVNGTTGEVRPSADAIRDVKVTVTRILGNVVQRVTGTILVRSGV